MIDVMTVPAWAKALMRHAHFAEEQGLTPRLDSPGMQHARDMLALALEHDAQAGRLYAELSAAIAPAVSNRRHAVLQFVAAAHQFSCAVLRSQHDCPAHVVDFATGLLSEAAAFVVADEATQWG
jgi:hypothetical protein